MSMLEALSEKPVDWDKVEAMIRASSWRDAENAWAYAHFHAGQFVGCIFHLRDRSNRIRRALASVYVQGNRTARSVAQADSMCKKLGRSPTDALNAHFGKVGEKSRQYKVKPTPELVQIPPDEVKKIGLRGLSFNVPSAGGWWEGETLNVHLQYNLGTLSPEQLHEWFTRFMDEA